ncbi:MAG TPA: hypothetical protein VHE55_00655 [Fimbriimonadaceae bacterium]|nr:hypothetical protein [Fimbriimonadaceae bacterium]
MYSQREPIIPRVLMLIVPMAIAIVMLRLGVRGTGFHDPQWLRPCCFMLASLYLAVFALDSWLWITGGEKEIAFAKNLKAATVFASGPAFMLLALHFATSR